MAYTSSKDQTLVAEQSGFTTSFIAIVISLALGFTIRALLSPEKVKFMIEKAAQKIHRDVNFKIGDAYVSLSRGILPDLSVVIKDISIDAKNPCWMSPLGEVNEIRLPLSFSRFLRGEVYVHEVLLDEVQLSLRAPVQNCEAKDQAKIEGVTPEPVREVAVAPYQEPTSQNQSSSSIDEVSIRSLKINYLPIAFTSFEIEDFSLHLKSQAPKLLVMNGLLKLGGETLSGDYSSQAQLYLEYSEATGPNLKSTVKGLWREGHYNLALDYFPAEQELDFTTELKHIPLSQIFPLLKKYKLMSSDLNGKETWLSLQAHGRTKLNSLAQAPINITSFKIEGEIGEISGESIDIQSLEPFRFQPAEIQLKSLNLDKMLIFLGRGHPTPALAHLGTFKGVARLKGPEDIHLLGEVSGLEFIFSNRGHREVQNIALVMGEIHLLDKEWSVQLSKVKPLDGILDGQLRILADRDWRDVRVSADLEELTLSPRVQSLMTGGGQLGAIYGQVKLRIEKSEVKDLNGQVKILDLNIEGLKFKKPQIVMSSKATNLQLLISAEEVQVDTKSALLNEIKPLLADIDFPEQVLQIKKPSVRIETKQLHSLSWSPLLIPFPGGKLKSEGGWDTLGQLSGQVLVSTKNKNLRWKISGSRDEPQFSKRP